MWIESLILGFFTFLQIVNGGENQTTTTEFTKDYSINSISEERHAYSARVSYFVINIHYY